MTWSPAARLSTPSPHPFGPKTKNKTKKEEGKSTACPVHCAKKKPSDSAEEDDGGGGDGGGGAGGRGRASMLGRAELEEIHLLERNRGEIERWGGGG